MDERTQTPCGTPRSKGHRWYRRAKPRGKTPKGTGGGKGRGRKHLTPYERMTKRFRESGFSASALNYRIKEDKLNTLT